ncbi:uncharacterized protein LOC135575830 isoform X2 [Columba livia]|uniref:uncharacterized protein LOC135575830 isoform X2 n=1 Tax=Columba livia TaxID=8932 RepID=UPI0031BB6C4A
MQAVKLVLLMVHRTRCSQTKGKNEAANGVCSASLLAGGTGTGQQMDGADGETLKQSLSSGFVGKYMAQILASASCIRLCKRHRYGITGRSVCERHGEELIACFAFGIRRFAFLCGAVGGMRPWFCGSRFCGSRFCGSRFCGSRFCGSQTQVNLLQCQVPFLPGRRASQDPPVGHPGPQILGHRRRRLLGSAASPAAGSRCAVQRKKQLSAIKLMEKWCLLRKQRQQQ